MGPSDITTGPDGALWFTSSVNNSIGRITTTGTVTRVKVLGTVGPTGVMGIAAGADRALWVTGVGGYAVTRIAASGAVTTYPAPSPLLPVAITAGPDRALWVTGSDNVIARFTTSVMPART